MGSVVCQSCHEEIFNTMAKNPHWLLEQDAKRGFKEQTCEACHGPGSVHTESVSTADIRNPLRLSAQQANIVCLTCHRNQTTRVGVVRGGHARNQVACTTCHGVHRTQPAKKTAICGTCHEAQLAQFQRPYRHRLQEGGVDCVDCHNPHGRLLANPLRDVSANEPSCFRCHGDKRGPFAFEHFPVRTEGCQSCHEPHGSANPKMLARHEARFLCLECHANTTARNSGTIGGVPPAFHDLLNPRFQYCTLCHVKVHGSHVNRELLR
ncbi:MAG: DmsE family decaheme c-type cytochrome [Acidobacteria bacterium]|nr:DmsE family decaheme c-type cytochrome [Acidobacteriota bacterium]